ncbi:hypothetical protein ACFW2V_40965 [Streptomyces sp. NPDC058947]|uniref:Uncharacterized protein n=1 Tax=Streptomyces sp. R02 TaxID=3238623 RepID=A0AB39LGP8_9ACTN|nr:hypothetical protein [Streptomyces pseudogriseolus]
MSPGDLALPFSNTVFEPVRNRSFVTTRRSPRPLRVLTAPGLPLAAGGLFVRDTGALSRLGRERGRR